MANTILIAFSLCLILCGVISKPVTNDLELEKSTDTVEIRKINDVTVLPIEVDTKQVRSEESGGVPSLINSVKRLRRVKREMILGSECPSGHIYYLQRCMTFEL